MQKITYEYNTKVHSLKNGTSCSLVIFWQPPGPTTTEYPTKLPRDETTDLPADKIRMRLIRRLYLMTRKVRNTLTKSQKRYKRYFEKEFKYIPTVNPGPEVYLDKLPSSMETPSDILSGEPRCMIQTKTYSIQKILEATAEMLTIREDGIPNIVSIYRTRPVPRGN